MTTEEWQKANRQLSRDGWVLGTNYMTDGTVEHWAEKDGVRVRRDPPDE